MASLAFEHGLPPDRIWKHPENDALRQLCKDPDTLLPGQSVFIPDPERRTESGATEQRHRFLRRDVPKRLRVRLRDGDRPLPDVECEVCIDADWQSLTTDSDGWLEFSIAPDADRAKVIAKGYGVYVLKLGHADPVNTTRGLQKRLANLGYYTGPIDDRETPLLADAVQRFQQRAGLGDTGKVDDATRQALVDQCGD